MSHLSSGRLVQLTNNCGPYWWLVKIDSCEGLMPSGNKPLPEPLMTPYEGNDQWSVNSHHKGLVMKKVFPVRTSSEVPLIWLDEVLSCWTRWDTPADLNSSDAGDGIFWLLGVNTMPADTLAPKVTRASAGMVLALYFCFRVNFVYLGQAKSKIWFEMGMYRLWS